MSKKKVYVPISYNPLYNKINWADFNDEDSCAIDEAAIAQIRKNLPTQSLTSRSEVLMENLPETGPFKVKFSNFRFTGTREDIAKFFMPIIPTSIKLLMTEGASNNQNRGYGFAEFATRQDLLSAIQMTNKDCLNRPLRVELMTDDSESRNPFLNNSWRRNQKQPESVNSSDSRDYKKHYDVKPRFQNFPINQPNRERWNNQNPLNSRFNNNERDFASNFQPTIAPEMQINKQQNLSDEPLKSNQAVINSSTTTTVIRSKNIFGDAMPVDTQSRLLAIEKKFEEQKSKLVSQAINNQQQNESIDLNSIKISQNPPIPRENAWNSGRLLSQSAKPSFNVKCEIPNNEDNRQYSEKPIEIQTIKDFQTAKAPVNAVRKVDPNLSWSQIACNNTINRSDKKYQKAPEFNEQIEPCNFDKNKELEFDRTESVNKSTSSTKSAIVSVATMQEIDDKGKALGPSVENSYNRGESNNNFGYNRGRYNNHNRNNNFSFKRNDYQPNDSNREARHFRRPFNDNRPFKTFNLRSEHFSNNSDPKINFENDQSTHKPN